MNRSYDDLLSLTDRKPSFFQSAGVPRWGAFRPQDSTGVYARECAIAEIACQACDTRFHVLFERGSGEPEIAERIGRSQLAYRDPPNVGCCASGPTMTSETLRVIEYWRREPYPDGWTRDPSLETAFRRFDDPWSDEMRDMAKGIVDDPEREASEREQMRSALAWDDERRASPRDRPEPTYASEYQSGAATSAG